MFLRHRWTPFATLDNLGWSSQKEQMYPTWVRMYYRSLQSSLHVRGKTLTWARNRQIQPYDWTPDEAMRGSSHASSSLTQSSVPQIMSFERYAPTVTERQR
ncbi:hypothetical protein GB937_000530 [Aspergillus fischeri]|nr:hypothetical protein GB937_000530 [Aspergillus fischeri]